MLRFDTRDITKGNLSKDDFQYLAQNGTKENSMNESSMYGGPKTSFRKLENTLLQYVTLKQLTKIKGEHEAEISMHCLSKTKPVNVSNIHSFI